MLGSQLNDPGSNPGRCNLFASGVNLVDLIASYRGPGRAVWGGASTMKEYSFLFGFAHPPPYHFIFFCLLVGILLMVFFNIDVQAQNFATRESLRTLLAALWKVFDQSEVIWASQLNSRRCAAHVQVPSSSTLNNSKNQRDTRTKGSSSETRRGVQVKSY